MSDFSYEIVQQIGVISENTKGWRKELNLISWNQSKPKLDLREWSANHEKMGKGITMNREEAKELQGLLYKYLKSADATKEFPTI